MRNRLDEDLSERAFLLKFTPALPSITDAIVVPPLEGHTVTSAGSQIYERGTHSRWAKDDSTFVLFFLDSVYANETIEYRATVATTALARPVEMTSSEVDPSQYAPYRVRVGFADSPQEQMIRVLPEKFALLARSPTGTVAIVVSDGAWRTATATYQDLIPPIEHDGFSVHLFRDADDALKLELQTRGFPGGLVSMPISDIPAGDVHVIMFGWTEKGMGMKVDLRPTVHLGEWQ